MTSKMKQIQNIFFTSAILLGSLQFNTQVTSAVASGLTEDQQGMISQVKINKTQYSNTVIDVTNRYNKALKGFSGFFKKNHIDETDSNPTLAIRKIVSRNGRTIQTSHRSLSVGINDRGNLQTGRMIWPTNKVSILSGYGPRGHSFHHGLDIYDTYGANVYSVTTGTVVYAGWMSGYGNLIELKHNNGVSTRYGHLSSILVSMGQKVGPGDVIGKVGMTGRATCTHLHFEVRLNGVSVPPLGYIR